MSRLTSLAVALVAVVALLATTGTATADAKRRLANVPFQTSTSLTAFITPSRGLVTIYYRCTSRLGGRLVVASGTFLDRYDARCDGAAHSKVVAVITDALLSRVTLEQGTAARAGFSVWE
jgi:hypothetical protein